MECDIFSTEKYAKTFEDAIFNKEIKMSRYVIENSWNIGSLHSYYKGVDFTFRTKRSYEYKIVFMNDIMNDAYKTLWNKDELVFIKGNRDIIK